MAVKIPVASRTSRFKPIRDLQASPGWVGAALSGFALVAVAAMLVVVFGFLDSTHYTSIRDLFTPDPPAAAGILGVVGGAEGVNEDHVRIATDGQTRLQSADEADDDEHEKDDQRQPGQRERTAARTAKQVADAVFPRQ